VSKKTSRNSTIIFAFLAAVIAIMLSFPSAIFASTDAAPPKLSVSLSGDILMVTAEDEGSGVAAVYIDGHRVDELIDGTATVGLKDYAGTAAKVAIYAVDGAGNRSETVEIDNPYQGTSAQEGGTAETGEGWMQAAPSPESMDGAGAVSGGAVQGAVTGTPAAFTPEGTGSVLDTATDRDGKEFYTITTEAGNIFYLIIDRQRTDNGVYFLNAVTEDDLVALAEAADEGEGIFGGSGTAQKPQDPVAEAEPAPEPENEPEPEKNGGASAGTITFVLIAVAIFGAAAYYVKVVRPKRQTGDDDGNDEEWDSFFGDGEDADMYPAELEETGYLPDDDEGFLSESPSEESDEIIEETQEDEGTAEQSPSEGNIV
jgi:hypothetical protein